MMEDFSQDMSVNNYMDKFYLCHVGKDKLCEDMVAEHTLVYVVSGEMDVFQPDGKTLHLHKGDAVFMRRNHKVRKDKHPYHGEAFNGLFLHLDTDFLKQMKKDKKIAIPQDVPDRITRENVFPLGKHPFLDSLFKSLITYFNSNMYPSGDLMDSKLRETVFVLLQLRPELKPVLFDFAAPYKTSVRDFMEENFRSNLTVEQFAHFTGRSLTSFKKDFDDAFHITPQRWLTKRRLEEAYRLMMEEGGKPSEIYMEVGFKNLSHFSTAFRKEYGMSPTKMIETIEKAG